MAERLDSKKIQDNLLKFTTNSVKQFLADHPGLTFYAFAFDCNAEYSEVNLCFNTEHDFRITLNYYQKGQYSEYYQSEEDIAELKYNIGDWQYQCFDTLYVMTEKEMAEIYSQNTEQQVDDLMTVFCQTLIAFTKTDVYATIPKTDDFKIICIDHDEDLHDAEQRLEKASRLG